MKFKIYKYNCLTSTNDKAIYFIKNKNIQFGYIHSEIQTKGRGTYGKKWISTRGNLFGSIFFPLKKNYPSFNEFTFISPIIIYNVVKSFYKKNNIALKWPNDILISKKKICGILQEVVKKNDINYLIIGIGVNLVNNPIIKKIKTTNIFKETNVKINKDYMIKKIINSYEDFFFKIKKYKFNHYQKKANLLSVNIGKI